jgi:hypothetical protein
MTNYLLTSLRDGTLTYFLLSPSSQFSNRYRDNTEESLPLLATKPDTSSNLLDRFHDLHTALTLAFHQHWVFLCTSAAVAEEDRPTVMAFEQVFKRWCAETSRWLRRGALAGWWDARGFIKLNALESDKKSKCVVAVLLCRLT